MDQENKIEKENIENDEHTEKKENKNHGEVEEGEDETTEEKTVIDVQEVEEECEDEKETYIQKLEEEIEQLKKEKDDLYNRLLRVQADYDNFKKRTEREKIAERKYKSQDLANELLPALDNFERALAVEVTEETKTLIEGIEMVYRQIQDALKNEGIEVIDAVGKKFDPNLHHAVMQVEVEEEESNVVIEELQKGYILKDRVIRPAMVKVNK